ncbi:D-alanine--D-alanine ligase [Cellulosilyticum sp. ST5]|uniref:D-alanine--D-alanine ligase n=1 Tax=unclassified Cellulosilyticum TaxID=2643091 RepID=UPI000F8E2DE9|nr:D-alanine--D-alanine ligase [Cellulosilyticum sp. WCF-2]QEH68430.1 D-alanine--D-alanine ligase [Cellulosilyticum sp. WCF-2]
MKVGIIMGGISSEKEVSLKSGEEVLKHINKTKYEAIPIVLHSKKEAIDKLSGIDFAFLALHGRFGEDGTIQALLETLDIPYSGCRVLTSALCMNKHLTKKLLASENITTPKGILIKASEPLNSSIASTLNYPLIVKPNTGGSSIGTCKVENKTDLLSAIDEAFKYDEELLIEEYIAGEEITSFVLDGEVFPTVCIKPRFGQFFDYNSKYTINGALEEIALLPSILQDKVTQISEKIWALFSCKSYCRIDFIIKNETIYVLEINTLPGLTETSLIPQSAKAKGIDFTTLIDAIIRTSMI